MSMGNLLTVWSVRTGMATNHVTGTTDHTDVRPDRRDAVPGIDHLTVVPENADDA